MKRRMRSIEHAIGHKEFWVSFQDFLGKNNFSHEEMMAVMHMLNSFYFMGADLENEKQS